MEMTTGNTVQGSAMVCNEEARKVACEYQEGMRRFYIVKSFADQMKERGILSSSEYDDFLADQAKKYSLDPLFLGR